ncbi:MAG: FtsX-like permease family protein [Candidatus Acidiferrum sp.]|jgi:putative ABC transport system permease protein
MKTRDLTELAFRNLREAILRNSLTTLGVAVGVASLVAMLSLGVGLQTLASQRLNKSGLFDSVFVSSKRGANFMGGGGPRPTLKKSAKPEETKFLDETSREEIGKLPNVTEVYPQIRFLTEVRFNGASFSTNVLGLPDSSRNTGTFDGITGKAFSSPTADEAILQSEFAKELSPQPGSLVGQEITLRYAQRHETPPADAGKPKDIDDEFDDMMSSGISIVTREKKLRIAGIIDTDPSAGFGGGGRVFIPLRVAEDLHVAQPNDVQELVRSGGSGKRVYFELTARVKSPKDVLKVEEAVKKMGFNTFSLLDATRNLRLIFTVFDLFLGLFGSLALTVASLGIINTLVMAILERRREIGVLKALGATDRDVRSLFFAEAGAMGLLGGIAGVTLGWLIGAALTWGTTLYLRTQDLPGVKISYVPWWLAVGAIVFAVLVSLLAGLYPAGRAAKLNPVEALRYE